MPKVTFGFPSRMASGKFPGMFAEALQQVDRTCVRYRGRKLVYFAGCDYLRLSSDPRVVRAVEQTLHKYGLNVAASRKTTGNHVLYEQLERRTAEFFGAEKAIIVSNGYLTNLVAAQGLAGSIDRAYVDERAHQSLKDAALLLGARVETFPHRDAGALRKMVSGGKKAARSAILTDGMFAHDGSVAPLAMYRKIAPSALVWVDDAHAGGIVGANGRGTIELAGLSRNRVLQTVTFSKAFGVYGGAMLVSGKLWATILERSGIAVGNTPLPLPLAGGVLEALRIAKNPAGRKRLWKNIDFFHRCLGRETPGTPTPIIPVMPKNRKQAEELKAGLLRAGIYPSYIIYPGGPKGGYFRFALSSEHTEEQIERLAECLGRLEKG